MKTIITIDKANQPYGFPQLDGSGYLNATGSIYNTKYKVYTALLTQTGGSNPQTLMFGAVTKGVTYTVVDTMEFPPGWNYSNVGGPIYPNTGSFVATANETPSSYNTSYLTYNTGAPVVTVLENTLGDIVWSYDINGSYFGTLTGVFLENKTFILITPNSNSIDTPFFTTQRLNDNIIVINTFDGLTYTNSLLTNTPIEIRVYN